jgi:uncharacterized protein YdaU (DUF1376 family)
VGDFNAKASRAKRPCPLWVDAFQRDTQHLEADEVGAYFLILMAMWTRESCDFPNDPSRLSRVSRVSLRLWKSRIGPALIPFFGVVDGALTSKRLREEATYVERQVQHQHDRKVGEKSGKPLENNEPASTADISTDEPRHHPSQQPNLKKESADALSPPVKPARRAKGGDPEGFAGLWDAYPHRGGAKQGRAPAVKAYERAVKAGATPETILAGALRFRLSRKAIENFAPDPATWLNRRGWEDEAEPIRAPPPASQHGQADGPDGRKARLTRWAS